MISRHNRPVRLFFSYSHRDLKLVEKLRDHLAALEHQGMITGWHDRKINPGIEWEPEIDEYLNTAKIILLLISPSFMASNYCNEIEVQHAMERHKKKEARVIPVVLHPVAWEDAPFSKLQALPDNAKPVSLWRNRDQALMNVAEGVKKVAKAMNEAQRKFDELPLDYFYINHTSFLRKEKQEEFRRRTGLNIDHYDIRVVIDSYYEDALDKIQRVKYILDEAYPTPVYEFNDDAKSNKFLLKELANGEYVLKAEIYLEDRNEPVHLQRFITLWKSGPELPKVDNHCRLTKGCSKSAICTNF